MILRSAYSLAAGLMNGPPRQTAEVH
jgi:hypothetical protein